MRVSLMLELAISTMIHAVGQSGCASYAASLSCLSEARADVHREQQSLPLSHISTTGEVVSVES